MNQKGLTLIEVIISLGLLGFISVLIIGIYLSQNSLYKSQSLELKVNQEARSALDTIDSQIRLGNRVTATFGTFSTGPEALILKIQSINAQQQLIGGIYDYAVVYKLGADLFLEIHPDATSSRKTLVTKLASGVNTVSFTYNNADLNLVTEVSTALSLTHTNSGYNRSINASSRAKLRNY